MTEKSSTQKSIEEEYKEREKVFHKKGFTSLLLFFSFLVLVVSGVVIYGAPKGRVAH